MRAHQPALIAGVADNLGALGGLCRAAERRESSYRAHAHTTDRRRRCGPCSSNGDGRGRRGALGRGEAAGAEERAEGGSPPWRGASGCTGVCAAERPPSCVGVLALAVSSGAGTTASPIIRVLTQYFRTHSPAACSSAPYTLPACTATISAEKMDSNAARSKSARMHTRGGDETVRPRRQRSSNSRVRRGRGKQGAVSASPRPLHPLSVFS